MCFLMLSTEAVIVQVAQSDAEVMDSDYIELNKTQFIHNKTQVL